MTAVVVDTNVILVANDSHEAASPECVSACVRRLAALTRAGVLLVDDEYRILTEYQRKTNYRSGRGAGDAFVRWTFDNLANPRLVQQLPLTPAGDRFAEFPDPALELEFDVEDRVFPAVANAHPGRAAIWQAVDCKWLDWWPALARCGIPVEFLCRDDISRFYGRKFPGKAAPVPP